jgi:FAD/FMN-containing dehydrogenase
MSVPALRSWNSADFSYPAVIATPKNLAELIAVVKDHATYPSPLRVAGHRHSMTPCFATTGTQVLLHHFNDIAVHLDAGTVTVGANVDMYRMRNALRRYGMQAEVAPEIGNATAGSIACSGTKDSSLGPDGLGQLSSTVEEMRWVNPRGEVEVINAARDPEKMYYARSSNGLFGVIYEVTFRIQKPPVLQYTYAAFPLDRMPDRETIFGGADGVLGFMTPYSNRILAERRTILGTDVPISRLSRLKRKARDTYWELGATSMTTLLPYNRFYYLLDRVTAAGFLGLGLGGGFRAHRSDSMVNFKFKRWHVADFTFWAMPVSCLQEFMPAYVRFIKAFEARTGFRMSLLSEVYFLNRDDHSLLSYAPDEDIFTCDGINTNPHDPRWIEFNKRYNDFAADFGGRPLFTQTKYLSRAVVARSLGAPWERFLALREQQDPDGRFLNDYFRGLIPSEVREPALLSRVSV